MGAHSKELFSYNTLVHALAGSLGSMVGMSTFFPLDTVRSRLQLEENREAKNTFAVLQDLVKEEGFITLYRGIVPVLQSLCVSNFVYFYTFHGLKAMYSHYTQSAGRDLMFASVAGVINVLTTTPMWVVNTRLKMSGIGHGRSPSRLPRYNGILDGLRRISREEGVGALWNGTLPSLLLVINPALQMAVYESIKRRLAGSELNTLGYFMIGAVAKAIATTLTYPLQLVQTRLRHGHNYRDLSPDAGMVELTVYILKKFGIAGLYKGMEAKVLQTVLTAALMFAVYEKIAHFVFKIMMVQPRV
ncbi:peroxisomal membrane protein PMP34 [Macrosteles quadrilineatus]|uniref:peroxisomal membrane protein PMP34 n=1 Tax=Macrosteles quadrilineatus TaxID=74068 RepID=UPI0023E1460A|nr:peroxisomal membrane protein PMP34 [Macrosteles quadrilineatus]